MDKIILFFTSMGFGFAVAAPVGPMALLCMRRTLARGWIFGAATGAGIAVADSVFATLAAFGLATVSDVVLAHEQLLHGLAGVFLLYLGLKTFFPSNSSDTSDQSRGLLGSWPAAFLSALLLTLSNPPTIILFAAIFATLAPKSGFDPTIAFLTVAGIFAGSLSWWAGLTAVVSTFRNAIGPSTRRWIDWIAGGVLAGLGCLALWSVV